MHNFVIPILSGHMDSILYKIFMETSERIHQMEIEQVQLFIKSSPSKVSPCDNLRNERSYISLC
jgi:hypothetical protein